jgi:hypothetical protein
MMTVWSRSELEDALREAGLGEQAAVLARMAVIASFWEGGEPGSRRGLMLIHVKKPVGTAC